MTKDNTTLTILSTKIRQDAQVRFCLNDCHRASGVRRIRDPENGCTTNRLNLYSMNRPMRKSSFLDEVMEMSLETSSRIILKRKSANVNLKEIMSS